MYITLLVLDIYIYIYTSIHDIVGSEQDKDRLHLIFEQYCWFFLVRGSMGEVSSSLNSDPMYIRTLCACLFLPWNVCFIFFVSITYFAHYSCLKSVFGLHGVNWNAFIMSLGYVLYAQLNWKTYGYS